jgi:hypothetical protein
MSLQRYHLIIGLVIVLVAGAHNKVMAFMGYTIWFVSVFIRRLSKSWLSYINFVLCLRNIVPVLSECFHGIEFPNVIFQQLLAKH